MIFANDHYEEQNIHTDTFYLWCRKLRGLSAEQIAYGMERIEGMAGEAFASGREMWPPSYAEFIGLCNQKYETAAHKYFDRSHALENKTLKESRNELGRRKCAELMQNLFGDEDEN